MKALIGYTGFVGGTINSKFNFDEIFNSSSINQIDGKEYELVVCAAAPGKKWLANQEPEVDKQAIDNLISHLKKVKAERFVLISTVDVCDVTTNQNEDYVINKDNLLPYGLHRLELEEFVNDTFSQSSIIRLPALFGVGLKKNFIFDLINNRMLDYTHSDSKFQFYNMDKLWEDIQKVITAKIPLIHFVTEPVRAGDIANKALGITLTPGPDVKPVTYNLHTKHALLFNSQGNYITSADKVLKELIAFIKQQRSLLT